MSSKLLLRRSVSLYEELNSVTGFQQKICDNEAKEHFYSLLEVSGLFLWASHQLGITELHIWNYMSAVYACD
jgi:hypothetical protein